MRWTRAVGASGLALWLTAAPAHAEAPPEVAQRIAFARGQALEQAGRFVDAWLAFDALERTRPTAEVTLHAALCLEQMGRLVHAKARFLRAHERATASPLVRREASLHLSDLEARLPRLTVTLTGPKEGVVLLLDGEPLAEATETRVDPGPHVVVALRDGRSVAAIAFASAERQARHLRLPIRLGACRSNSDKLLVLPFKGRLTSLRSVALTGLRPLRGLCPVRVAPPLPEKTWFFGVPSPRGASFVGRS